MGNYLLLSSYTTYRVEPISGDVAEVNRAVLEPVQLVELAWLGVGLLGLGVGDWARARVRIRVRVRVRVRARVRVRVRFRV